MTVTRQNLKAFITIAALVNAGSLARAETPSPPDYNQPLFTRKQTPICQSRDDLQTLLGLMRNGQRELLGQVQGCMSFPVDGVPVVVLDREGFLDIWMRVRLMERSGNQPIVWTVGWMLRNDDSPKIVGDPAKGAVRLCLNSGYGDVHVPTSALLKNAGIIVGDLKDRWDSSRFKPDTMNDHAAFITTEAADLTADKPCAEVAARMFIRDEDTVKSWSAISNDAWDFDHVLGYVSGRSAQPEKLELVHGEVGLRAKVLSDLGNPVTISEEDAIKANLDNPLNRIPKDMQLAATATSSGPNGKGNFRVCLWKDIDDVADRRSHSVAVSKNVIFESAGKLIGDLRSPEPDLDYMMYDRKTAFAVITLTAFTLSKQKPCAIVPVRSVLSNSWPWLFPLIREGDHLHFQALKIRGRNKNDGLPGHLGEALDVGALNGMPIADMGRP